MSFGLFYAYGAAIELFGYTDADWARNVFDQRSTRGYCFALGSGMISWSSKKQPTVALSSIEARYRCATVATCEVSWLKVLLDDFGYDLTRPVTLFCDNMSSMQLANNPVFHARTKHIEVYYHFVHEKVLDGTIEMVHVPTQDQVVNIFTKALPHNKHCKF